MHDETLEELVKDLADLLKNHEGFTTLALAGLVAAHTMAEKASDAEYRYLLSKSLNIIVSKLTGEDNAGPTAGVAN